MRIPARWGVRDEGHLIYVNDEGEMVIETPEGRVFLTPDEPLQLQHPDGRWLPSDHYELLDAYWPAEPPA